MHLKKWMWFVETKAKPNLEGSNAKRRKERVVERAKARREWDGGVHSCTKASCWSARRCTHRKSAHPRKKPTVDASAGMHVPFKCRYVFGQVHACTRGNGTAGQPGSIEIQVHACTCPAIECCGQVIGTYLLSLFGVQSFAVCILDLHTL